MRPKLRLLLLLMIVGGALPARGAWLEGGWPYRRAVDVEWPKEATGNELAVVDVWTAGHHRDAPDAARVATEAGEVVPCRLLWTGPGDKIKVAFAPRQGIRLYYVYFGNAKAPPQRPKDELPLRAGLLLEMRKLSDSMANNFRQMERAWADSRQLIGRTMLPRIFLGINPFGEQTVIISKYTGKLYAPADGRYTFAASASDKGALYLDGRPVLFVPNAVPDARHNTQVDLKRGPHDITFYHANFTGEQRLVLAWKTPNSGGFEVVPPEAFGLLAKATAGAMESKDKPFIADFRIDYIGEAFFADGYAHRYRFTAQHGRPSSSSSPVRYEWDFGDGQSASTPAAEQVYLADGEVPVRLTIRAGLQTDTQTMVLPVSRMYERLDNPPADLPSAQQAIVSRYDLARLPAAWVPRALLLHVRTRNLEAAERTGKFLAGTKSGDPDASLRALNDASELLCDQGRPQAAAQMWETAPADSTLQPTAARKGAEVMLWYLGDAGRAVKVLSSVARQHAQDADAQRVLGQALILNQQATDGAQLLNSLPVKGLADRQAAVSGAMARTVEYYITERDAEAGERAWNKWQEEYPADFLEGYSVLLQTKLMELRKESEAAAKVAEAFALAMPRSSYAPMLLDRASRLLAKTNAARSNQLRAMLKQKYPEDPLSQ